VNGTARGRKERKQEKEKEGRGEKRRDKRRKGVGGRREEKILGRK
jgi:hypothetical protein